MKTARIGNYAQILLVVAFGIAAGGFWLERSGAAPWWGRLLMAFGEAALVGGLADWFAVTALFSKPLGFPFHTALIPRKRRELAQAAGEWVQNDLLTAQRLKQRLEEVDFVSRAYAASQGEAFKGQLRSMLRTVLGDAVESVDPDRAAGWLGELVAGHISRQDLRTWIAGLADTARDRDWLWPLAREWMARAEAWGRGPESRETIHEALKKIWGYYKQEGTWLQRAFKSVAEVTPIVDLEQAAASLAELIVEFAQVQQQEGSDAWKVVRDGLDKVGDRLRDDDAFYEKVKSGVLSVADAATLKSVMQPVLDTARGDLLADLADPESRVAEEFAVRVEAWIRRVNEDEARREVVNTWIRRSVERFIDRHHSAIGLMVQEQMNRLEDAQLVAMIQDKTGNDLQWIRINGSIVGGCIGLLLFFLREALSA